MKLKNIFTLLAFLLLPLLYLHNVPTSLSHTDKSVLNYLLTKHETKEDQIYQKSNLSFSEELVQIKALQSIVQAEVPIGVGIPLNQPRQPKNVIEAGSGLCYDRAYTLAKLYRYLGWNTRHVALYQNDPDRFDLMELLSKEIRSHASLEVKTQRGWLIVDPDEPWIGLAIDSSTVCYFEVSKTQAVAWLSLPPVSLNWHLTQSPIAVYGLYSRHGRFFPPYNTHYAVVCAFLTCSGHAQFHQKASPKLWLRLRFLAH